MKLTTLRKPVARVVESRALIQGLSGERLVVILSPEGIYMRQVGTPGKLGPMPYGTLMLQCARLTLENGRATRKRR